MKRRKNPGPIPLNVVIAPPEERSPREILNACVHQGQPPAPTFGPCRACAEAAVARAFGLGVVAGLRRAFPGPAVPRVGFSGQVFRWTQGLARMGHVLALAVHRVDLKHGTEGRNGGVGPMRLPAFAAGRLVSLANQIVEYATPDEEVPF